MSPRQRTWLRGTGVALVAVAAFLAVLDVLFPPPLWRAATVSTVVEDRNGHPLRAFPVENGRWRLAASLEDIDPAFVEALVAVEDQRFYHHYGVDILALLRASMDALRTGRINSGASTITMQTARLLEPRERTIPSKIIEIFRAAQIERRLTKEEILELYLTFTPYGGNLESVRAASWAYLGRDVDTLTLDQIALLIALPQAPEARRPDLRPDAARAARGRILERLVAAGLASPDRAQDAADEALPIGRAAFPSDAWHASDRLARASGAPIVQSTLDIRLQREAERMVRQAALSQGNGVQSAALLLAIDNRAVLADVGSAGRDIAGGWIDLTARPRSPGSTLKPFIYALAFDDGIADGATRIDDLPARFATYRPENFDRTFRGEVTVAQALQHSLNVPAVQLLDAVGANRFISAMTHAGSNPILSTRTETQAGLAVALGGLGMTVQDVALLYGALGDAGVAKPLRWVRPETVQPSTVGRRQLMSGESADEILNILAKSPAPPGRMPAALSRHAPDVAYKTGTSYGFRDAWAAGVGGGYVAVVWIGRADGAPRAGVTGRDAALPLLFNLLDAAQRLGPLPARSAPLTSARPPAQASLSSFADDAAPPLILFPPDGADIWADGPGKGFVLSARGSGTLEWFADGAPVSRDAGGAAVWTPASSGFYRLVVVDEAGRSQAAHVRVRMAGD